jgi:hypothetical protein
LWEEETNIEPNCLASPLKKGKTKKQDIESLVSCLNMKTNANFIQQPKQLGTWEHFESKRGHKHELLILGLRLKMPITFC